MLRGTTVYLRLFEPEDYLKTFVWHNDYKIQSTTCGSIRIVSKEIERDWVLSKSRHNQDELYLAICLNETDEMIGWYSITNIDFKNRKCDCSGVVIGDNRYRDGNAYLEASDLAFQYIINELNMNRIAGSCLSDHILSRAGMEANYWKLEGIEREAIFKNGKYHDICHYAILRRDYFEHLNNGDYNDPTLRIARMVRKLRKEMKC